MPRRLYDRTKRSCQRVRFTQQSWASGETGALTSQVDVCGKVVQVEFIISNATNGITFTGTVTNADSSQLYTQAAVPENASTPYFSESNKGTQDADFNPFWLDGVSTVTLTPSGDPGASGVTVDFIITVE